MIFGEFSVYSRKTACAVLSKTAVAAVTVLGLALAQPILVAPATIAIEMRPAIMQYSIDVAPDLSRRKMANTAELLELHTIVEMRCLR